MISIYHREQLLLYMLAMITAYPCDITMVYCMGSNELPNEFSLLVAMDSVTE